MDNTTHRLSLLYQSKISSFVRCKREKEFCILYFTKRFKIFKKLFVPYTTEYRIHLDI